MNTISPISTISPVMGNTISDNNAALGYQSVVLPSVVLPKDQQPQQQQQQQINEVLPVYVYTDSMNDRVGYRLAVQRWKAGKNKDGSVRKALSVARCVYVPQEVNTMPGTMPGTLSSSLEVWLQDQYEMLIDTRIRELIEEDIKAGNTTAMSIPVIALAPDMLGKWYAGSELKKSSDASRGKLTKDAIAQWFDAVMVGALKEEFKVKFGPEVPPQKISNVIEKYKEIMVKLAAPRPDLGNRKNVDTIAHAITLDAVILADNGSGVYEKLQDKISKLLEEPEEVELLEGLQ